MNNLRIILACCIVFYGSHVMGQQRFERPMELGPARCYDNGAFLDVIHQRTAPDQLIVVIARLGDGDVRPNLNWRRLENVRAYWTEFLYEEHRRRPEMVVLDEGERVKDEGRLEFYVSGQLVGVLKLRRNQDLWVGECYPPEDRNIKNGVFDLCDVKSNKVFYPCRNDGAQ